MSIMYPKITPSRTVMIPQHAGFTRCLRLELQGQGITIPTRPWLNGELDWLLRPEVSFVEEEIRNGTFNVAYSGHGMFKVSPDCFTTDLFLHDAGHALELMRRNPAKTLQPNFGYSPGLTGTSLLRYWFVEIDAILAQFCLRCAISDSLPEHLPFHSYLSMRSYRGAFDSFAFSREFYEQFKLRFNSIRNDTKRFVYSYDIDTVLGVACNVCMSNEASREFVFTDMESAQSIATYMLDRFVYWTGLDIRQEWANFCDYLAANKEKVHG